VTAPAALQRPSPTLMGLRGPSRTRTRWSRMRIGCIRPVRRSTSFGHSTDVPAISRSFRRPSLDLRSPTECITGNLCRPAGFPAGRTTLPLVDFLHPTTQSQARSYVSRQRIPPLSRCHVRGLATPFAAITSGPPDAYASERPWASPFKVFPSSQAVPLSGSLPSCHYPLLPNTPRSARLPRSRLQGLVPATNPCSRRNHEWFRPSIPSWGSTLQSLLPFDLAHALIAAPPLSLLGGLTSRPA